MKKFLQTPLCAFIVTVIMMVLFKVFEVTYYTQDPFAFYEVGNVVDYTTYALYGVAFITAMMCFKDYRHTDKQSTFIGLMFLWLSALLREMGAQHWLTTHDSTAIKLHFFTNPDNPLYEKIISGTVILAVTGVALWLFCKYAFRIIKGFFKLEPLYWTIVTFGGVLIASKFFDRFPSRYAKLTGEHLGEDTMLWITLFEEGLEACLPLLFALALIQYHLKRLSIRR